MRRGRGTRGNYPKVFSLEGNVKEVRLNVSAKSIHKCAESDEAGIDGELRKMSVTM